MDQTNDRACIKQEILAMKKLQKLLWASGWKFKSALLYSHLWEKILCIAVSHFLNSHYDVAHCDRWNYLTPALYSLYMLHIYTTAYLHWQLITFRNKLKWFELPWYGILLDTVETVELPPLTFSKFILTGCEVQYPCRYLQQHSSLTERSSVYLYVDVDECLYKKYIQWSHTNKCI